MTLVEHKLLKGERIEYYPGLILEIRIVRDPFPKLIKFFIPIILLGILVISIFHFNRYDKNNRLTCVSISLLTFNAMMKDINSNLPEIQFMTMADKFIIIYISMSMMPILYIFSTFFDERYEAKMGVLFD